MKTLHKFIILFLAMTISSPFIFCSGGGGGGTTDKTAPTIINVTSSKTDGTYGIGAVISIQIEFSEIVNVEGSAPYAQLTLETGGTDAVVDCTPSTGTEILTFDYTVATGHTSADLNYEATNSLVLNSGTIQDAAGNDAELTLPELAAAESLASNKAIVINTAIPSISDVDSTKNNGYYTTGETIEIDITFSESVTVAGATPYLLIENDGAGIQAPLTGGNPGSVLTFTYTVVDGDTSADLDYVDSTSLKLNGATINQTAAPNAVANLALPDPGASGSLGNNKSIQIDTAAPTFTSLTLSNSADDGYIDADEDNSSAVATLTAADYDTAAYKIFTSPTTCNSADYSSGTSSTIPLSSDIYDLTDGETYIVCVKLTDNAGNTPAYGSTGDITLDKTIPTVSIGSPSLTKASSTSTIDFTITYSGATSVNLQDSDVTLNLTDTTCSKEILNGTTSTPTVRITNCTGSGSFTITLASASADDAGNIDVGDGPGDSVAIENTAPTLTSAETMDADNDGKIDHYKLTFDEDILDSTFPGYDENDLGTETTAWLIQNYSNIRLAHGSAAPISDTANDNIIYLVFDENASDCDSTSQVGCDTGIKPQLTTTGTPGLTDLYSNLLAQIGDADISEADRAKPIVVFVQGISPTIARVTFSEEVDETTSENDTYYSSTGGLTFSAAERDSGNTNTVDLTSSTQASTTYTVSVTEGVVDASSNKVNSSANSDDFNGIVYPSVTLAEARAYDTVRVTYSETVTAASAECSNSTDCSDIYHITGLTVTSSVSISGSGVDGTQFDLTTTDQVEGNNHVLTVTAGTVQSESTGFTIDSNGNTDNFDGDGRPLASISSDTATECPSSFKRVIVQFDQAMETSGASSVDEPLSYSITANCSGGSCSGTSQSASTVTWDGGSKKATVDFNSALDNDGSEYELTIDTVEDTNGNSIVSTDLNFQCGADGVSPQLTLAQALDTVTILLTFSEELETTSANNENNYNIDGAGVGVNIVSATQQALGSQVELVLTTGLAQGGHSVEVTGVDDLNSNTIIDDDIQNTAPFSIDVPQTFDQGPVFDNPFQDSVVTGMIFISGNKLYIGPDSTEGKIFEMTSNMAVSQTITLDSDASTPATDEDFYLPAVINTVQGIDTFYNANIAGTETVFIGGWQGVGSYDDIWTLTNPSGTTWRFTHQDGLETGGKAFRSMAMYAFKEQLYIGLQDQGGGAIKFSRMCAKFGGCTNSDTYLQITQLKGSKLNKLADGTNTNGHHGIGLLSIDSMHEYDHDGTGSDESRLYIANGGYTTDLTGPTYRETGGWDGGILRTTSAYSTAANPPPKLDTVGDPDLVFEDVTPSVDKWLSYMSIPLPYDAEAGGDWDALVPQNKITPSIKAIPYMRTAPNGDLYLIRNACSSTTKHSVDGGTFTNNNSQTCTVGSEVPQLWMLPKGTTSNPKGSADWVLVAENGSTGKTNMAGNDTKCATNTHITLLEVNGTYLYIGFDNADEGINLWYINIGSCSDTSYTTEETCNAGGETWTAEISSGAAPDEDDFSMISVFGLKDADSQSYGSDNSRIFSNATVNDDGTDYLIMTTGNGTDPVRVFRSKN